MMLRWVGRQGGNAELYLKTLEIRQERNYRKEDKFVTNKVKIVTGRIENIALRIIWVIRRWMNTLLFYHGL